MPRRLTALAMLGLTLALAATPVAAAPFPARIDLPTGFQPEGIAVGRGLTAFVGSLATGEIRAVDLRTGTHRQLVPGGTPPAVGIDYEDGADRLWVAGGPSGQVRAYDASTGTLLATYAFGTGAFLNDVAVSRDAVYVTDSFSPRLIVIPLGPGGTLPAQGDTLIRPILAPYAHVAGTFNANGIVAFDKWVLVAQSATGKLFAVDPDTGESHELLPAGSIPSADGLEIRGTTLYAVVRPQDPQDHAVARFSIRGAEVVPLGTMESADFSVPTTVAFAGGSLWVVNARFGTASPSTAAYWITQVPAR